MGKKTFLMSGIILLIVAAITFNTDIPNNIYAEKFLTKYKALCTIK